MLHKRRIWSVSPVESAEELARKLTQCTWCGCNAFLLGKYLFANDSTSADGAQEYAVLHPDAGSAELMQIESISFSWCSEPRALELIERIVAGEFDAVVYDRVSRDRFQTPREHGTCHLCQ